MIKDDFSRLVSVVNRLLSKDGCKWDKSQDLKSLRGFVFEEVLELIDALEREDINDIEEEIGDILYHIVFISKLTKRKDSLKKAITRITDKLIKRHPHVFMNKKDMTPTEVVKEWENIKREEKNTESIGYGLFPFLSSLLIAYKLGVRSKSFNFDWENVEQIFEKLEEEINELKLELKKKRRNKDAIESEIGDVLFVIANIARHLNINPEIALMNTNKKFIGRFDKMNQLIKTDKKDIRNLSIEELEFYWQKAKRIKSF
ncbi:MAG: nucleoside triphosphate pyrophosphohydrolase [Deltaproteobacteria bacterium]|nr:nucleoside triphosphate pyrophosphohydrolase [Deltaproteobacteria bacterium]